MFSDLQFYMMHLQSIKFILYWFSCSLSSFFCLLLFSPPPLPSTLSICHLPISTLVILLPSHLPRSCRDHSDYQEFSGSVSTEDEYLPIHRRSTKLGMTRLDPPPHRANPRAWMDEARSRDRFSSQSGTWKLASYIVTFVGCFVNFLADTLERVGKDAQLSRGIVRRRRNQTGSPDLFLEYVKF